jgi:hypothetical protein
MGKFMKFGVVVAVMLCAAGAFASNFRVADQVYVAAIGHIASSRTFISDVFLTNVEDDAVDVSVLFTGSDGVIKQFKKGQPLGYALTLAPHERREIIDFVAAPYSQGGLNLNGVLGEAVFNGCKADQDCTPDQLTGENPNFRNISVETRIYSVDNANAANPQTAPSNGQLFAGTPWYSYVSSNASNAGLDKVFITGIRNTGGAGTTGTYRTNIGLANASQFSTTTLLVKLFDGKTGAQIGCTAGGSACDKQVTLGPLSQAQPGVGALFPTFVGATATNAYVTVEQIPTLTQPTSDAHINGCDDGCPAFLAYGSMLDNATGDATTLEPQYFKPLTKSAQNCIYLLVCATSTSPSLHRAASH